MKKGITVVFLSLLAVAMSAQTINARRESDKLNRRAEGVLYELKSHAVTDSVRYFRDVMDVISYSIKSDNYDRDADKNNTGKLKHEEANRKRLVELRPLLIDAGLYLYQLHYRQDGISAWKLYIDASKSPLVANMKKEDETALAAFYIAQSELEARNYNVADRYADLALADDDIAQYAAEIKAQCMNGQMKNHEDSLKYLTVLYELYNSEPSSKKYFAWIMQFYGKENRSFNLEDFIDRQLQDHPNSPVPWILKGEAAMHAQRWDEAADAYSHADELDSKRIPVVYNIGVCLMNKAIELGESNPGKEKDDNDKAAINSLYAQARNYLERVKAMDPKRKAVDWVTPLYQVYEFLGDKIKADELKPLVKAK